MGSKVAWAGLALSELGLGHFIAATIPVGAVVLVIGVVMIWLDK